MFMRIIVCILSTLISAQGLSAADFTMKVTDKNYLDTQGFSVFLYDSTYHPVFVDQKNTAMEMILHGQRIATNGDVRLMPTPSSVGPRLRPGFPCRQAANFTMRSTQILQHSVKPGIEDTRILLTLPDRDHALLALPVW